MRMIKSGGSIILIKQVFMQFLLTRKRFYFYSKIILIISLQSKKFYSIKRILIGLIFLVKGNSCRDDYLTLLVLKKPNSSLNFGESFKFYLVS